MAIVDTLDLLKKQGDQLFTRREPLMSLWQEIAENFYPERATFTMERGLGTDYAAGLSTSYPIVARRDLGNTVGIMLRQSMRPWFKVSSGRPDKETTEDKQWLEWLTEFARNVMSDKTAQFSRATKEADMDFVTFGQAALSVELNKARSGLLYRNWHLRDVVWVEDAEGEIGTVHRRWKATASDLIELFPKTVSQKVRDKAGKEPYYEYNVRHVCMPLSAYRAMDSSVDAERIIQPYVSIFFDYDHGEVLELVGRWAPHYIIPRWQTLSGSQYAYSPAVSAALPDARLLQQMTAVILEAGEKVVTPPMLAVQEAIRGDVSIFAGGITWVDSAYDSKLGAALSPLSQDRNGLSFGFEIMGDVRKQLAEAFYLSKLNLPPVDGRQMTAYEVSQRMQEFVRHNLPLFEPMEDTYNGGLCDTTVTNMIHRVPEIEQSMPPSIRARKLDYIYESPLHEAIEKIKVGQFMEANQILAQVLNLDPSMANIIDVSKATREVMEATVPTSWLRSAGEVEAMGKAQQEQQQTAQLLQTMQQGAEVAKTLGEAAPAGQAL